MAEPTDTDATTEATTEGKPPEQASSAPKGGKPTASSSASGPTRARSTRSTIAAPEPEVDEEPGFTWARILHPQEGPAILRHEWHTIVGAFQQEIAAAKADASLAEETITRSRALARVEEWLREGVDHDNIPPAERPPAPEPEQPSEDA